MSADATKVDVGVLTADGRWGDDLARRLGSVDDLNVRIVPWSPAGRVPRRAEVDPTAGADVALVDVTSPPDNGGVESGFSMAHELMDLRPDIGVVLVAGEETLEVYRRAIHAGARALLTKDLPLKDFTEAIYAAQASRSIAPGDGARPAAAGAQAAGATCVVAGLKGGVGRTTLATNLAVALAERGRRVALFDLDFAFGTAHVMLDVVPVRPLSELLADIGRLDADLLGGYLVTHASGVHLLPPVGRPEIAEYVKPEHVERLLEVAAATHDVVLVDTPVGYPEVVFPALDRAETVLMMTTPDLAAVAATRAGVAVLDALRFPRSKLRLVLNRADHRFGVRPEDLEATLDLKIWSHIPWAEPTLLPALNRGVAAVAASPRSPFAQAIERIATQMTPQLVPQRTRSKAAAVSARRPVSRQGVGK